MNREQAKAMLPLIQAFAEGKEVQVRGPRDVWGTGENLCFDGSIEDYRIKPEEKWDWAIYCTHKSSKREVFHDIIMASTEEEAKRACAEEEGVRAIYHKYRYARVEGSKVEA